MGLVAAQAPKGTLQVTAMWVARQYAAGSNI
jgi:hypothetical protein